MGDLTGKSLADRPEPGEFCVKCVNCKFWNPQDGTEKAAPAKGLCQRTSPKPVGTSWAWAETNAADWCGEGG